MWRESTSRTSCGRDADGGGRASSSGASRRWCASDGGLDSKGWTACAGAPRTAAQGYQARPRGVNAPRASPGRSLGSAPVVGDGARLRPVSLARYIAESASAQQLALGHRQARLRRRRGAKRRDADRAGETREVERLVLDLARRVAEGRGARSSARISSAIADRLRVPSSRAGRARTRRRRSAPSSARARPTRAPQQVPDLAQHLAAGEVAVGVVDALEVVEVEEEQRQIACRSARQRRDRLLERRVEVAVVVEAGQVVALGDLLRQPAVEHVLDRDRDVVGEDLEQVAVLRRCSRLRRGG